ncbi:MAG TPA: hypothetical protein VK167_05400 [Flavipsychrobacter sp.]|nr:hypothetical protein [Flavipsychrobacter sp.]
MKLLALIFLLFSINVYAQTDALCVKEKEPVSTNYVDAKYLHTYPSNVYQSFKTYTYTYKAESVPSETISDTFGSEGKIRTIEAEFWPQCDAEKICIDRSFIMDSENMRMVCMPHAAHRWYKLTFADDSVMYVPEPFDGPYARRTVFLLISGKIKTHLDREYADEKDIGKMEYAVDGLLYKMMHTPLRSWALSAFTNEEINRKDVGKIVFEDKWAFKFSEESGIKLMEGIKCLYEQQVHLK